MNGIMVETKIPSVELHTTQAIYCALGVFHLASDELAPRVCI